MLSPTVSRCDRASRRADEPQAGSPPEDIEGLLRRLVPRTLAALTRRLLTDARRPARIGADGNLVPLAEQDRTRWDRDLMDEGQALITDALATAPLGPYQLQAAIAAVHGEAASADETDWRQIDGLYRLLDRLAPSPVVTLNRAAAVAMVHGPDAGLKLLATLDSDEQMVGHHRVAAVRAHLLELAGNPAAAASYREAARLATSLPERRYLESQAARLS